MRWCALERPSALLCALTTKLSDLSGKEQMSDGCQNYDKGQQPPRAPEHSSGSLERAGSADALALMTAGREQDQAELKITTKALDRIACDYEHMTRKDMVKIAAQALCDIGAWRKVKRGEFARHGQVISTSPPNGELTDAGPVTPASRETQSRHSVQ